MSGETKDDDDFVTIRARVRIDENGDYLIRDTQECGSMSEFDSAWDDIYFRDDEIACRDALVEIRIRKPPPLAAVEVTVPDEAEVPPAEARAV